MLQSLQDHGRNANLLMNLSIAAQCLGQAALGLSFQQEALALQRTFTVAARIQPARLRLLVLVTPGNIQSNTPLECLLEVSDVELLFHFVTVGDQPLAVVPAHDVLFVGVSDSDANHALLQALESALAGWAQPVLNAPQFVPRTGRDRASSLLQGIPGLLAPPTRRVGRAELMAIVAPAASGVSAAQSVQAISFPLILRPVGSQAGADLQKIDSAADIAAYLKAVPDEAFFWAPFSDYSDASGQFRKIRIALIAGQPFVCHMALSSHWMIHYVNAGMYTDASKRDEEARFMADFASFASRHRVSLDAISQRMQLDYLVMDCAETPTGDLLLFEIDHGGVVHAMDDEQLFPYKNGHIARARLAFCEMLYGRLALQG
jgi:hypothetical protein